MNPTDEYIIFSDSLAGLLEQYDNREKQAVKKILIRYMNEYKRLMEIADPLTVIVSFHFELDRQIEEKFKIDQDAKTIQCKKGCYFCCEQNIDISLHEGMLLYNAIKEEKIEIDMDKLERQSKYIPETWHDQPEDDWSCVFLQKDHNCAVYEYRPASCRKYFVSSIKKFCDTKRRHQIVKRFVCVFAEIVGTVIFNQPGSGPLPKILIQSFNDHDTKRKN